MADDKIAAFQLINSITVKHKGKGRKLGSHQDLPKGWTAALRSMTVRGGLAGGLGYPSWVEYAILAIDTGEKRSIYVPLSNVAFYELETEG